MAPRRSRNGDGEPVDVATSQRAWRVLAVCAALLLLTGLLVDAWTHRYRPDSDAGHLVLVVGAAVLVLGAVMLLVAPLLARSGQPSRATRFVQVALPVVTVGLLGPALVATASATTRHGNTPSSATASAQAGSVTHDHGGSTVSPPADPARGAVTSTPAGGATASDAQASTDGLVLAGEITGNTSSSIHDHGHGSAVVPDQPVDDATRAVLAQQLQVARAVALTYPTVADAEKAGYIEVTPFVPLIGAHYLNPLKVDATFDPAQPEMLLYDGTRPESKIVGLSYFVSSPRGEPAGFAGPNDHWHQHIGLCIKGHVVVGGEKLTREECLARGGKKVALRDIWMVHAWVVPGWDSPQGVFSPEHQDLLTED